MSRLLIDGGHRLNGEIAVHGAKNAVLPLLAATLLADGESLLHNVPALSDVDGCLEILQQFGCRIRREGGTVAVSPNGADRPIISDALMRKMRSSIVFLGAMMARFGEAYLSYPGGCELGPRPIDLHLSALRQMGAEIIERRGQLRATLPNGRFRGCTVSLAFPSVGATENVLLAAVTAEGTTTLLNAAREPEIADLAAYLSACGADIRIDGGTVTVRGVPRLTAAEHTVMPDRIEAATYLAAAAVTEGRVTVTDLCPAHIATILPIFSEMGCQLKTSADSVTLEAPPRLKRIPYLRTMPYPGFPTDAAAPLLTAATLAKGTSVFVESIFECRYKYVGELIRMGAHVQTEGRVAVVEGVRSLSGAAVDCTDLRGGAALVVAALAAEGRTAIGKLEHLDRGYASLEDGLSALGARIRRVSES